MSGFNYSRFTTYQFTFSENTIKAFVIPARIDKFKIGELDVVNQTEIRKFDFQYKSNMGDITLTHFDSTFPYELPYKKGKSFLLFQGYNGKFSHQNKNALDFTMPKGTEILAARGGVVVKIVQHNSESCPREACVQFNNYVTIYQSDGTFAQYEHIKQNGAKVTIGDRIQTGDLIALSGNTGWTNGPHLHFSCFLQ